MSFKKSFEFYNLHIKSAFTNQLCFCRADLLFRIFIVPNIFKRDLKHNKSFFISKVYFIHILFAIFSIVNILIARLKHINIAHYLVDIKNSNDYYDFRSKEILEIVPPSKSINFMHINNLKYSFVTLLKKSNVVYFESLYEVIKPFLKKQRFVYKKSEDEFVNKLLEIHQNYYSDSYYIAKISKFIFKFLNIEKFITLDDIRYTNELNLVSRELNIEIIAYMHGRFNKYHLALYEFPFDKYFVWSEYFKNLLKDSKKYKDNNLIVSGHIRFKKQKKFIERKHKILWVGESNIDYEEIFPYIEELLKNNYEIVFRGKLGSNSKIDSFLNKNNIYNDNSTSFFSSLENNSIGVVVGTHSTTLMESWIVGIPSFAFKCSYDYGSHLWEDKIIELCEDTQFVKNFVDRYFDMNIIDIERKKIEIWGKEYCFNKEKIEKNIKGLK